MTSIHDEYLERHNGNRQAAAIALAVDLMQGAPANFQAGYTLENAALAAAEVFPPENFLGITFSGDAGETFDGILTSHFDSYSADIYPEDGGDPVEGILCGVEADAEWYGTVKYREHDGDWFAVGPVKTMRVRRIHIH